ncbi:MAG: hypothetical protein V1928_00605 [Parcubacteria group bacterium]
MKKTLVCASDAGGANAILPVVKRLLVDNADLICVIDNQARELFRQAEIEFIDARTIALVDLHELMEKFKPDLFLAGTSLGNTIDKDILLWCRERFVPSVYVLDFWANYWQRFSSERKDFKYLPDYICVMDDISKQDMVDEGFAEKQIIVTGNPHFDHFADGISLTGEKTNRVLFVSQPLRALNERSEIEKYGYDEYQVLKDVLHIWSTAPAESQLIIRLHPNEDRLKFNSLLDPNDARISLDNRPDVKESISAVDLVIGMNSIVLFQAVAAGKPVISYQPGLKRSDPLISNRLGLSELFTDFDMFSDRMKVYFNGKRLNETDTIKKNYIIKNATQNAVDFLNRLATQK